MNNNSEIQNLKSILFISFHKCATSHISKNVLTKSDTFKYIDYQNEAYKSNQTIQPIIQCVGHVYGVVRIVEPIHPLYELTNSIVSQQNIENSKVIFMIRDPRDILVSMYYSFGFTHGFSKNVQIKRYQVNRRESIQTMSLDDYVIAYCDELIEKFEHMGQLIDASNDYILLKYEDMILDFDKFYTKLDSFLSLDNNIFQEFYEATRPRLLEDKSLHKRSGKVNDYLNKLKQSTIKELNFKLNHTLLRFNYIN